MSKDAFDLFCPAGNNLVGSLRLFCPAGNNLVGSLRNRTGCRALLDIWRAARKAGRGWRAEEFL